MPQKLVEYKLADGTSIFVESIAADEDVERRVGRSDDVGKSGTFSEALSKISQTVGEIKGRIADLSVGATEVSIELGVSFVGETGIVIAKASTEANLSLRIVWGQK